MVIVNITMAKLFHVLGKILPIDVTVRYIMFSHWHKSQVVDFQIFVQLIRALIRLRISCTQTKKLTNLRLLLVTDIVP